MTSSFEARWLVAPRCAVLVEFGAVGKVASAHPGECAPGTASRNHGMPSFSKRVAWVDGPTREIVDMASAAREPRPAHVFSWSIGVLVYEDAEARELAAKLRAAWPCA